VKFDEIESLASQTLTHNSRISRSAHSLGRVIWIALLVSMMSSMALGQSSDLSFSVSNPKHKKWPADEAQRIYVAACDRVARTIRPEKPPLLQPKFVLVLGADHNEAVRIGKISEIRLKEWNPGAFSDAVVVLAAREILDDRQLASLSREVLLSAEASVSVADLEHGH
jgi:hypothetical protein